MNKVLAALLPIPADNRIRGTRLPVYVFALLAIFSMVRSAIHLLAPDGGAGSIAGLDLSVKGAAGIVFAFALWGSSQLLFAIVQLVVALCYRSLVPLMYLLLIFEVLLRILVGQTRPVTFAHTPPGQVGNFILLPLAALMLALSLWSAKRPS